MEGRSPFLETSNVKKAPTSKPEARDRSKAFPTASELQLKAENVKKKKNLGSCN